MDENATGATITAVSTENATEITVDNDHFEVADGNLKLKADSSLDFEAVEGGTLEVNITASGEGESATHTVTVTVNDVNEAPTIDVRDGETPDGMAASSTVDENVAGALLGAITLSDPDAGQTHTLSTSDDRFVTKQDAEGGWWLALADGASLNYEDAASVTVTVTVTDDGDPAMSASTDVTITVNDVNEAPVAVGTVANITTESGDPIKAGPIDLLALFGDPDSGDVNAVRYELSGNPDWLRFSVQFGEDEDGNDTAHGIFDGTPPTTGPDSDAAHMVTLTATDSGGAEGSVSFYVIVDDGNDIITSINLFHNPDDDGNEAENVDYVYDVDENVSSGYVFGRITVSDQDHRMHPNGMHMVTVDNDSFEIKVDDEGGLWLALKEGEALDHEKGGGFVTVEIQVVDLNGEENPRAQQSSLGKYKGNVLTQDVTININDKNDAPTANAIGNWWVTIHTDLEADEVTDGSWLNFWLDTEAPGAAFSDVDRNDELTYSISGQSWVQIDEDSGKITNKEGMLASRGSHRVTVTATDEDGATASASFMIIVARSDDADTGVTNPVDATNTLIDDNDEPDIRVTTSDDYFEGSGDQRIATIRVEDEDQDINGHPFSITSVEIVSVVDDDDPNNDKGNNQSGADFDKDAGLAAAFRLGEPVRSGETTLTYGLYVMDTNPSAGIDTTDVLDHETVTDIEVTIRVTDGVGATEEVTVDVGIEDSNEAPVARPQAGLADTVTTVEQFEEAKQLIYIKLFDVWEDLDNEHDDGELTYSASTSTSWIKILHGGPREWGDIRVGPDDDVEWDEVNFGATPDDDQVVVVVEIDRTGRNKDQDAEGSFTLTARDLGFRSDNQAAETGTVTVEITVEDENLLADSGAVTLTGGASPREGGTLRARFDETKDPDLAGSKDAALVYYTWETHVDTDGTPGPDTEPGAGSIIMVSTSADSLPLTQDYVGLYVSVTATYYETFKNALVAPEDAGTASAVTSNAVANSNDRGTGNFNLLINGTTLTAESRIRDEDYDGGAPDPALGLDGSTPPEPNGDITYYWEVSANGRGGWKRVDDDTDNDNTLTVQDGKGQWYRFVAEYDADDDAGTGGTERLASSPVQVSETAAPETAPTISGSPNPGGTLIVNARGGSVRWQEQKGVGNWVDIPGATGNLVLNTAHSDKVVRAVVTYESDDANNPGAKAIVLAQSAANATTFAIAIGGAPAETIGPVTVVPNEYINVNVDVQHGTSAEPTLSVSETVDLHSLFQDPDSSSLTFTVTSGPGTDQEPNSTTFVGAAEAGVMVFEPGSGDLTYVSDVTHGHDGDPTDGSDGGSNVLTIEVQASDLSDTSDTASANVNLRINVAPTSIIVTDGANPTITENVRATGDEVIRELDVQDENSIRYDFGVHDVKVSGDDRFIITNNGNGRVDVGNDGSTWQLRLKKDATFDFEAIKDADTDTPGKQIELTLVATDGGGLTTPVPNGRTVMPITIYVTIVDVDAQGGDRNHPSTPNPNDVPGLRDNDSPATPENDRTDGDDDDTDGGVQPPPPGTSIGGIIENFVDNMDTFEQDLLEDFMLVIDDGIDIA